MTDLSNANIRIHEPSLAPWHGGENAILVLMSGGVDSSVTAMTLQRAGLQVLGVTMVMPDAREKNLSALAMNDDVLHVCRALGIAHYYIDIQHAFEQFVIGPFRQLYADGRTPNPCAYCNKFIKFGLVWDAVRERFGIEDVATGHYARIVDRAGRHALAKAADASKDQSYFLYGIPRERLAHIHFPLGGLRKDEVRRIARANALPVAERPESMDLCFAGGRDYRLALGADALGRGGPILDTAGKVLGQHDGIENFTIGQRKGVRVAAGKPIYVIRIDAARNAIVVGTREDASRRTVRTAEPNVLLPDELVPGARVQGKIRSYGSPDPCTVDAVSDAAMTVTFDTPQFAPTPGQRLVLYNDHDEVVGGGIIESSDAKENDNDA